VTPEELGHAALDWLIGLAEPDDAGLTWPWIPGDETDPTLYSGSAGVVLALLEGHRHFGDDRYADAALRGARSLAATTWPDSSLFMGLTGIAVALRAVHRRLGDAAAGAAADRALAEVRSRFDGERWNDQCELLNGNAGIALGALWAGDVALAELAVTPYPRWTEPVPGGVHWEVRIGMPGRPHHIAHGTLGIVAALAAVGHATGRTDLVDLAVAGASGVVARNDDGPDGLLVPHSDPPHKPGLNQRYSYGWCNGPAGDAQVFRLLHRVTGDPRWAALVDRCWHTVTHSGLPQRSSPGFWDNNGRCCGTAGVLALAGDRPDGRDFADVLVADLTDRATVDAAGARWCNHEHRRTPSTLDPRTGWAMGNAGIVPELLRHARRDSDYAVTRAFPAPPRA
jgi:hypothetical protein